MVQSLRGPRSFGRSREVTVSITCRMKRSAERNETGASSGSQDTEERLKEEVLSLRRREPAGEEAAVSAECRTSC